MSAFESHLLNSTAAQIIGAQSTRITRKFDEKNGVPVTSPGRIFLALIHRS